MSLADWLAGGADPAKMTPEEARRELKLLAVREEQATAKLERLLDERERLFRKGATTPSVPLRRVLARRHARTHAEVRALERELARVGKEIAGFTAVLRVLRDQNELVEPGDCTPLLTLLDDASAEEEEFADQLSRKLRGDAAADLSATGIIKLESSSVMDVWGKLDRGEFDSPDDALRAFERN